MGCVDGVRRLASPLRRDEQQTRRIAGEAHPCSPGAVSVIPHATQAPLCGCPRHAHLQVIPGHDQRAGFEREGIVLSAALRIDKPSRQRRADGAKTSRAVLHDDAGRPIAHARGDGSGRSE